MGSTANNYSTVPGKLKRLFSPPQHLEWFWGPFTPLFKVYWCFFPKNSAIRAPHRPWPPPSTKAECSHTPCPSTSSWCTQWPLHLYLILLKFQPECSQLQQPQLNSVEIPTMFIHWLTKCSEFLCKELIHKILILARIQKRYKSSTILELPHLISRWLSNLQYDVCKYNDLICH